MPSIVFVTQVIDPDDPDLGFVVPQLRALARHCDRLRVIANEVRSVPDELGAIVEVTSLGKERGRGRVRRLWRYMSALRQLTSSGSVDALYLHMCPEYVNAAAPLARLHAVPMVFWYVHSAHHLGVRAAGRFADAVLTTFPRSYPKDMEKVHPIGHAIDTDRFAFSPSAPSDVLRLVAIGRTSTAKRLDVALRAVAQCRAAHVDVRLRIVGSTTTEAERRHRQELRKLVSALDLNDAVAIESERPQAELPAVLAEVDALVNCAVAGTADKVVFEAMATGRPVLVSNPVFRPLLANLPLELSFPEGDSDALARRISELAVVPRAATDALSSELRDRVVRDHSLDHWANNVVSIVEQLADRKRSRRWAPWNRSAS